MTAMVMPLHADICIIAARFAEMTPLMRYAISCTSFAVRVQPTISMDSATGCARVAISVNWQLIHYNSDRH